MFVAGTAQAINGVCCRYLLLADFQSLLVTHAAAICRHKTFSDLRLPLFYVVDDRNVDCRDLSFGQWRTNLRIGLTAHARE